jgi:hypothetical protein
MPASDSSGRQTAKDYKNQPLATWCRNATFLMRGIRAHGALLQVVITRIRDALQNVRAGAILFQPLLQP